MTAILMMSCSKYKEVWEPYFHFFNKYWKDCPFDCYFGSDNIDKEYGFKSISLENDSGWAKNFLNVIDQIDDEYIMLFQEDFLLMRDVDTEKVLNLVKYAEENDVGCLRLAPCPGPTKPWNEDLGQIGINDEYRVSMQLAIWHKDVLKSVILPEFTPWDIETKGTILSRLCKKPFLSLWRESEEEVGGPIRYYITAIVKGKWHKGALDMLIEENFDISKLRLR
jgi:hypothetical protein